MIPADIFSSFPHQSHLVLHGSLCQTHTPLCTSLKSRTYDPQFVHLHTSSLRINEQDRAHTGKVLSEDPADRRSGLSALTCRGVFFLLQECMNPCCNATTCTLTGDAVCAHGQCCDDCKVRAFVPARIRPSLSLSCPTQIICSVFEAPR